MKRAIVTLLTTISTIGLTACGHSSSHDAPPPCTTGVNSTQCSLGVQEHSSWAMPETWSNQDQKTQQTIPGSQRNITIFYEFEPSTTSAPKWRRSMIIESTSGNVGMFEEGYVTSLTNNSMNFTITKSTCDDAGIHIDDASPGTVYYQRIGNSLQLSDQPIQTYKSIADAIANTIVSAVIVQPMQDLLTQVFTFGSARTLLTADQGNFNLNSSSSISEFASKQVKLGCFSKFGTGFSVSKIQADW